MSGGIYICYAHNDAEEVRKTVEVLWNTIQNTIWFEQETSIEAEEEYRRRIDKSEYFVFMASRNALKSVWCKQELLYANRQEKEIIVIYLEDCELKADSVLAKAVRETHSIRYYLISDEQMAEEFLSYVNKRGQNKRLRRIPAEADLTYDIFISYRRGEATLETKIVYEHLTKEGYTVFLDKDEIHSGKWEQIIRDSIRNCKDFLLFLTPTALDSENVRNEVKWALEWEKHITLVFVTPNYTFPKNLPENIVSIRDYNAITWLPDEINAKLFSLKKDFLASTPREGMNQETDEKRTIQEKSVEQKNAYEIIEKKLDDSEFSEVKELIGNPETNPRFNGASDSEKGRLYKYLLWAERGMRWSDDAHKALVEPFYGPNYNAACRYGYREELESINRSLLTNMHAFIEMNVDLRNKGPYQFDDPKQCDGDYRYLWECILFQTQNLTCFEKKKGYNGNEYISYKYDSDRGDRIKTIIYFIDEFKCKCPEWLYNGKEGITYSERYREFVTRCDRYVEKIVTEYKAEVRHQRISRLFDIGNAIVLIAALLLQVKALFFGYSYFQALPNKNAISEVCMYAYLLGISVGGLFWDWKQIRHFGRFLIPYGDGPGGIDLTSELLFHLHIVLAFGIGIPMFGLICCLMPIQFKIKNLLGDTNEWYVYVCYTATNLLSVFFATRLLGHMEGSISELYKNIGSSRKVVGLTETR